MFRPDRALDHYLRSVATLSKFNFSQLLATLNALGEDLSIYHSKRDMLGRICAIETEVFEKDYPTSRRFHILKCPTLGASQVEPSGICIGLGAERRPQASASHGSPSYQGSLFLFLRGR
jgi:hypothetical protein